MYNSYDEYKDGFFEQEAVEQKVDPTWVANIARGDRGCLFRAVIITEVPVYVKDTATDFYGDTVDRFVAVHCDDMVARCGINKMWKVFDALVTEKKKKNSV